MNIIWGGAFALAMCFMPETLPTIVIAREVKKRNTDDPNAKVVAAEMTKVNVFQEIRFVLTMALRIMCTEPIVIFLGFYNGFAYGSVYLLVTSQPPTDTLPAYCSCTSMVYSTSLSTTMVSATWAPVCRTSTSASV